SEEKNPIEDYEVINNELKNYDLKLEKKTQVIIANKSDLPSFEKHFEEFSQKYPDLKVIKISAINKENLNSVKDALWNAIIENKATPVEEQEDPEITIEYEPDYEIS
ncbi:GTPase ObgE, partial [Mycoplasmopsis pullorum]